MTKQSTMTINCWGTELWGLPNGDLHRTDGPAIVYLNGTKKWFINGVMHRETGPAVERHSGEKEWWINGKLIYREGPR